MELYIIEKYKNRYPFLKGRRLTDALILDCLKEYGIENPEVQRTDKGKPYSTTGDVHLSVSHTKELFLCIIDEAPVGIDVEVRRATNFDKISHRYFTAEEKAYIDENGEAGFFKIWTRKEAYSKLTGRGLEEIIKGTPVLERDDVEFTDMQLEDGVWCAYCVKK
ncbi:MAG: 4'-phosphopantetheinyl transferase superfamily protein [Bacillota bacterium]|nr:4'-phosphopantetheinyl transferase superfamily protein [Bacillota bacterium]